MAWISAQTSTSEITAQTESWLDDTSGPTNKPLQEIDPIEELRRRMETLGQNEGLERGLKSGEEKGFAMGFVQEASRAAMLGRCIGAGKALAMLRPKETERLLFAVQQAEHAAAQSWIVNPRLVDEKLREVFVELAQLGVTLPEWPSE